MDPPKLDVKSATPTKAIGYASIGLALIHEAETAVTAIAMAVTDTEKKTDEKTDEETDDIRNTKRESAPRADTADTEVQKIYPETMNEHVTNADSLVTSKLIAFTTNEFKNSVLKLRKPAGDHHPLRPVDRVIVTTCTAATAPSSSRNYDLTYSSNPEITPQ
ncbi:hypothetical protein BDD12DRAFT_896904 [Trichophaea hybrida]|nr:hypothetical protein BDD12DRAFT_896904 [Trichophaea hybrida]